MIASKDLAFPFLGGTMAGQNVCLCSGCYSLVLSDYTQAHRDWHEEMNNAVRREGADGTGEPGPVADGSDDVVAAAGAGEAEVADPPDAERADPRPARKRGQARGAVT